MQSRLYNFHFFYIFSQKNLSIQKKSSTFAAEKIFNILTIRFNSQM